MVLNNEKVSRILFPVFPYSALIKHDPRFSPFGHISLFISPSVTSQDYHGYVKRSAHLRNHRAHFSFKLVSLFKVLGTDTSWEFHLMKGRLFHYIYVHWSCHPGFSLWSMKRKRGLCSMIHLCPKKNEFSLCLFFSSNQWGTLGLLTPTSLWFCLSPVTRWL